MQPFRILTGAMLALSLLTSCHAPTPRHAAAPAQPFIIPAPKRFVLSGAPFRVTAKTRLVVADGATAEDILAAETVQQELTAHFGLPPLHIVRAHAITQTDNIIVFGEPGRMLLVRRLLKQTDAAVLAHAEGYCLRAGPAAILVAGHDQAGTFYGAQTLCRLLSKDAGGIFVRGAAVDDYPSLAWRGVLLFVDNHSLEFHKKLIAGVLARYKMNNIILECEQARWDALGKAAPPWAISKADLRAEVAFARRYHMTVTTLIESVGHMGWLLADPTHVNLREDPQTPFAANVANPKTYQTLDEIYDEALDTFHSDALHIGGDEVTQRGRYPFLSQSQYHTIADAYCASRNSTTI